MPKLRYQVAALAICIMLLIAACNTTTPPPVVNPTIGVQPTIPAEATATVDPILEVTQLGGDQAIIEATQNALQTAQVALDLTLQAEATEPPDPTAPDSVERSEAELEALIDQAVQNALNESNEAARAADQASTDSTISDEEIQTILPEIVGAEEAMTEAKGLIDAYEAQYSPYLAEAYRTLLAIEEDLNAIAVDINTISTTVDQGAAAATETSSTIFNAAINAQINAEDARGQLFVFVDQAQQERTARREAALNLAPATVASDRAGAVMAAQEYLNAVQSAFSDNVISPEELAQIAQLGANASASLITVNGSGMPALAARIDGMTGQIAGGEWPAALADINALQAEIDGLP